MTMRLLFAAVLLLPWDAVNAGIEARAHIMIGQVPHGIDPNAGWERCLLP